MKEKLFKDWISNQFLNFEQKLNGNAESEIHAFRKTAVNNFVNLPFPSRKDEEWKYTNVQPILDFNFTLPTIETKISKNDISSLLFTEEDFYTIVFLNGKFRKEFSSLPEKKNALTISQWNFLNTKEQQLLFSSMKNNSASQNIFSELNSAFMDDALFIHVEKGSKIEKPLQFIYFTASNNTHVITNPRSFIFLEENSELKIVETFFSNSGNVYFTNSLTEIHVSANSRLEHVKIQREGENAFHISNLHSNLERTSNYLNYNINLGGKIVRNNLNAKFNAEGSEATLNGLFLGNKEQLIDNHTVIDHAMPHCLSHELYKGVLDDKSRGVFNGKIFVRKDAQKTNAFQENKTILLSNDSRIDAKPQLEIFADDVKCTHGATVGQLDKEALFYLKSRGFSEDAARSTLIYAFASDAVHSISIKKVRDSIEHLIAQKLNYEE